MNTITDYDFGIFKLFNKIVFDGQLGQQNVKPGGPWAMLGANSMLARDAVTLEESERKIKMFFNHCRHSIWTAH